MMFRAHNGSAQRSLNDATLSCGDCSGAIFHMIEHMHHQHKHTFQVNTTKIQSEKSAVAH